MIGQYLSQTNESVTVPVLQKIFGTKQGKRSDQNQKLMREEASKLSVKAGHVKPRGIQRM